MNYHVIALLLTRVNAHYVNHREEKYPSSGSRTSKISVINLSFSAHTTEIVTSTTTTNDLSGLDLKTGQKGIKKCYYRQLEPTSNLNSEEKLSHNYLSI